MSIFEKQLLGLWVICVPCTAEVCACPKGALDTGAARALGIKTFQKLPRAPQRGWELELGKGGMVQAPIPSSPWLLCARGDYCHCSIHA